ncbi:MAG TPA: hypothetical protein VFZ63_14040 [Jiangellaceae bacterium]
MTINETAEPAIAATAWADLRGKFRGALLRPVEEGYEEARRVWNGAMFPSGVAVTRSPDMRCATEA